MPIMILALLVVLVLAVIIIAVVVMGMEGTGKERHPEIAHAMARTARHLNGEGEPPKALMNLIDEMEDAPRDLPNKLRSLRSARSAVSATSASVPEEPESEATPVPGASMVAHSRGHKPSTEVAVVCTAEDGARTTPRDQSTKKDASRTVAAATVPDGAAAVTPADAPASINLSDADTDSSTSRPVRRSGKRSKNRKRTHAGRETSGAERPPLTVVADSSAAPRPTSAELSESVSAALASPAVDAPATVDPYGVWGAEELDPEQTPAQQRVHLGRGRRG